MNPIRRAEVDHDRKGISGSPDLINTILAKIAACQAFMADVTPVGEAIVSDIAAEAETYPESDTIADGDQSSY